MNSDVEFHKTLLKATKELVAYEYKDDFEGVANKNNPLSNSSVQLEGFTLEDGQFKSQSVVESAENRKSRRFEGTGPESSNLDFNKSQDDIQNKSSKANI